MLLHHLKQLDDTQLARHAKVSLDHCGVEEFDATVIK